MDPEELDKQFQAMEVDLPVQAAEAGTPPAPPVRRRITTAQVKKELDALKSDIEKDVLDWLGNLDTRMESLEATTAKHNATLLSDVKVRLDVLDKAIAILQSNQSELMKAYTEQQQTIDAVTGSVNTIHDAVIELSEQPAATEIEFAKPPAAIPDSPVQTADIAAVASACLTMNDVLMICRALRDSPDTELMDKNEILNIACRSAGVEVTHGLQIRAGVHDTGA
jgi:uncharacterized coiled-coil protein SlyX